MNKTVKSVLVSAVCSVIYVAAVNIVGPSLDTDVVKQQFITASQNFHSRSVAETVEKIEKDPPQPGNASNNEGDAGGDNTAPPRDLQMNNPQGVEDWGNHCQQVHDAWRDAGLTYGYGVYHDYNGVTIRSDCSGFTSYCCYTAGYVSAPVAFASSSAESVLGAAGFTRISDYHSVQKGDILIWAGSHVQIFHSAIDGTPLENGYMCYNWGSASSVATCPISSGVNMHKITDAVIMRPPGL